MKPQFIMIHDIVEANGKTIKENNLEKTHNIPIGALVEYVGRTDDFEGCRLYVVAHGRDCDGTPLYTLGPKGRADDPNPYIARSGIFGGFGEHSLRVIDSSLDSKETK